MISNANPWDNLKFDLELLSAQKILWNFIQHLFVLSLYANIDGLNMKEAEIPVNERPEIDQWIISD
jgi:isoleucyl-tRNA synthetase